MQNLLIDHKTNVYTEEKRNLLAKLAAKVSSSHYLPNYHIYPQSGLMNDPNGLAYFNGKYHVFFQWYPFAPIHGLKHWGHTTSENLVDWSKQEIALSPTEEYEKNGCYSGNAIEFQGELYLFYTANYKTEAGKIPKQAVAIMDKEGRIRKRTEPVIEGTLPGLSGELRDPFVFERDGCFYMLLGGSKFTDKEKPGFGDQGVLLLYQSNDLLNWSYQGLIDLPLPTGYMLECPSLIQIDGKDILFLSPMGIAPEDERFNNRFASIYAVGELDILNRCFHADYWDQMDAGFDFYAPQAFLGEHQQPLLYGWFGCGEPDYPVQVGWLHGLTFPQQMQLVQGKFKRYPASEIIEVFTQKQAVKRPKIKTESRNYWLELTEGFNFTIGSAADYWEFQYDTETKLATVSRDNLAKKIDVGYGEKRSTRILNLQKVDIFVDNSFVELYLNQGEQVFTFRVFQDDSDTIVSQQGALTGCLHKI
ncbi:glycoside hydrolase family 32 protein [Enterococcus pallens]|uniref:Sucrose-6-phosphate hydrolase n=1 Tax=Enterococcus pallens ATCC BAA-351 TaxID=1158607 RepID=R2Q9A3_9ENTE|nr:glycoside hydrolase family 32 protein [Enterococcus pallens]EOH91823.1 sucrose-6-phosphate hydrolase [Enterococcus pallens ATCC BAA-351]EOU25251.1 hypothetical protein I588_01239 [Enterococcus pallens ATCC BAA-351]OJG79949.1 sucrose-6-phosphate hydrolase [Enterococcus pallens]